MKLKKINEFGGMIRVPMPCFRAHAKKFNDRIILVLRPQYAHDFSVYFLRMIEFYNWETAGSTLGGRHGPINREDYLAWYSIIQDGFSYDERYYGIYIEARMVLDFYKKYLPFGLTREERMVLNTIEALGGLKVKGQTVRKAPGVHMDLIILNETYCAIDKVPVHEVLYHELSHMLYLSVPSYKKEIHATFRSIKGEYKKKIVRALKIKGYSSNREVMAEEWASRFVGERNAFGTITNKLDDEAKERMTNIRKTFMKSIESMEDFNARNKAQYTESRQTIITKK